MDKKELQKLLKQKDVLIEKLNQRMEAQVAASQKNLLNLFITQFADKLQVDENGKVMNSVFNRNMLLSIDTLFSQYGKINNPLILGAIIGGVAGVLNFNQKYYSNLTGEAKLLPITERVQNNMRGWLGIEKNATKPNGYLDTLVKSEAVKNQLKTAVMKMVYGQEGWQSTKKKLSALIDGEDGLGALQKYHRNFSYDLYSQIDRATAKTYADDLKFSFAVYEGGLIKTSRIFCEEHNGNIYHKSEIALFDPKAAKPPDYNPFTDLGGYGCRHHLNWIPDALAKAYGKDISKFIEQENKIEQPVEKIAEKIDSLAKKAAAEIEEIKRPYETVYRDFDAKGVADAKTTAQLKEEFGRPIATKDLFKKPNVSTPEDALQELKYVQREIDAGTYKDFKFEKVAISKLNIPQQFVFEKPLIKSTGKKDVFVIRYKNKLYLTDGNHATAKAFLKGEKYVNAKIIDL